MPPAHAGGDPDAEPRPHFAVDSGIDKRGGFNLFGWMRSSGDEPVAPARVRVTDAGEAPEERAAPDPSLDEELEIPAFLRRQMTQR
jgi:hypothetical protein